MEEENNPYYRNYYEMGSGDVIIQRMDNPYYGGGISHMEYETKTIKRTGKPYYGFCKGGYLAISPWLKQEIGIAKMLRLLMFGKTVITKKDAF